MLNANPVRILKVFGIMLIAAIASGFLITGAFKWSGDEERFVLPDKYIGIVTVVYDHSDGQHREYDGSYRIYRVPDDGVLKTQFRENKGWQEFAPSYYYNEVTPNSRVYSTSHLRDVDSNTVYVFGWSRDTASLSGSEMIYEQFIVGYPSQFDSLLAVRERSDWGVLLDTKTN